MFFRGRRPVLFVLAALLFAGAGIPPAAADDFSGSFAAEGRTLQNKDYRGAVKIVDLGKLDAILWRLDDGEAYNGIALRMDDVLGAAYAPGGVKFGLVVYRVHGGMLEGIWADSNDLKADLGRESLEGPADLNGEYTITLGQNRDGVTNYAGKVLMKPNGQTFLLAWLVPNPSTFGVGIRIKDLLVVAYSPDPKHLPGVVAYQRQDGGTLNGLWSFGIQDKLGTEILTRRPQ